jgi:WD40 repeat protein/DNA-binding SARP family transcriptional activator
MTVLAADMVVLSDGRALEPVSERDRTEHERLLRSTMEACGGAVARVTGDGILVLFDECSAALRAAVAVQQSAARAIRERGAAGGARVGISLGPATATEGDVRGPAVIEAARLCAAAEGGQILCGDRVRRLTDSGRAYRFIESSALRPDGILNPLAAYILDWAAGASVPVAGELDHDCDFAVLGPLVVRSRQGPVSVGGLKEQTLLALLVAEANQVVSAGSLIEGIWGEQAPRTAAKTLQGYVLRLRQALEPDRARGAPPAVLVTTGAGYLLRVPPGRLDAARFEQLVSKAARERAAGDWAGAAASLRTAIALWRGEPYGQYLDAPACMLESERLTALFQAAVEDRVEADLAVGRASELVPELERLIRDNPFRERLWGQLMVALYRCGRQTEALRAYQRARGALVEEMGIEPGPELRRLEGAVLAQDPILAAPADSGRRLRRGRGLPTALEAVGPSFVGRVSELGRLWDAWREAATGRGGLVAIFGSEGAGKTRLSAELARRADAEGTVVCYARSGGGDRTHRAVIEQLLAEGGLSSSDVAGPDGDLVGPGPAATLARFLGGWAVDGPVLAVVDDLHDAGPDTVAFVAELGRACEPLPVLVLATARAGSGPLSGPLDRLETAGTNALHLGGLNLEEVVTLGGLYSPGDWSVSDAETVLRDTGGLPLAVHEKVSELVRTRASAGLAEAAEQAGATRSGLAVVQAGIAERIVGLQAMDERRRAHLHVVEPETDISESPLACPYKGLARFEAGDALYFFGRERLVARLTARLIGADLLVVSGPSGTGKSSAVRAGLLPALAQGVLPGSESWQLVTLSPGPHPVKELQRRLAAAGDADARRVIFVDQFEELFNACEGPSERRAFVSDLLALISGDPPTTLILAIRADELGQCAAHPELTERMAGNDVLVGPMSDDELRRAVEGPARRAGLDIEAGLVGAIVADVAHRPGALPLLSTALLETWERRRGRVLTLAGYREAGGVQGAVARLAESAFARLNPSQQRAARRLLLHLADVGQGRPADLRRRVPLAEILSGDDADAAVALDVLIGRRLLTVGDGTVEVTHEALLREWPRLKDWLEADVEGRRLHHHVAAQAAVWEEAGRHPAELLRGPRLAAALEWAGSHTDDLSAREAAFLETGRVEAEREMTEAHRRADEQTRVNRRLRRRLALLAVVAAVAVVAGVLAIQEGNRAGAVARRADALRLAGEAVAIPVEQLDRALLVARQAWQLNDSTETRSALLTVLQRSPRLVRFLPGLSGGVDAADVSKDGAIVAVASSDNAVRLFDPRSGRQLSSFATGQTGRMARVLLSPDGQTIVTLGGDATVRLWDRRGHSLGPPLGTGNGSTFATGNLGGFPTLPKGAYVKQAAFSPDGRVLVTLDQFGQGDVWDVASQRALSRLPVVNLPGERYDVAISPDGTRVALAGGPSLVVDIKTNQTVFQRPSAVQSGADTSVAFSADGRLLATASGSFVQLWDLGTGRQAGPVLQTGSSIGNQIAFSPDGHLLAAGLADGTTMLWDARTFKPSGDPLVGQQGVVGQARFVPGSSLMVTATNTSVAVWDTALVRPLGSTLSRGDGAGVTSVAFAPDGRSMASTAADGRVKLWYHSGDNPTGPAVLLPARGGSATAVSFSPDKRRLAVGMSDGSLILFDPTAAAAVGPALSVGGGGLTAMAFAPQGDLLAVGTADGGITLVDPQRWSVGRVIRAHQAGPVAGLAFGPDGSLLASSGGDGHLILVDVRHSRSVALVARAPETMGGLAYRPDGRAVAAAYSGGAAVLVNAPTGARSTPLFAGGGAVEAVAFSPDSRLLAAASADGTISLWDAGTHQRLGPQLAGSAPRLGAMAYSPSGRELITGSSDGTVVLWHVDPEVWAARACTLAGRVLNRQEWGQLLPGRGYHPRCGS